MKATAVVGRQMRTIAWVLAIGCVSPSASAIEQWVEPLASAPPAYVRGVRLFANTPVAGQSVLFASTLGAGVVKVTDNGTAVTVTQLNNGLPNLRIRTIAATDVNTLFAAVESWGVYTSVDGGANWTAANGSGGTALGCRSLRNISARTASEIWALGACERDSGVYRTLDGGATWSRLGVGTIPDDAAVGSITFNGTGASTVAVIATGRDGLFRSANNGATWTQINNGIAQPHGANRLSVFNASFLGNASQMLAYVEGDGIYRTLDGGATWAPFGSGIPAGTASLAGISRESSTIFYYGSDKGPIYRTTNGGLNWSPWGTSGSGEDTSYARGVTIDATAAGRYWVHGINGLFRTNDSGTTFTEILMPKGYLTSANVHPNGVTAYVSYLGIHKIPDVYASDWDPGSVPIGAALPGATAGVDFAPTAPPTLFVAVPNKGMYRSTDEGANWAITPLPNLDVGAAPTLGISPANPQLVYAGLDNKYGTATGGGFFISTNGGTTWTESSTGLTTPASRQINSIASTADPSQLVITTDDGIYRSTNGGASWTLALQVNDGIMPLAFAGVRHDVVNPSIVWATATHVDPDGTVRASSGVYKSVNGGASWTQVLSGKRASPIRPEGNGRVIVGLHHDLSQPSLMATKDGGITWQAFNNGIATNDNIGLVRDSNTSGSHLVIAFATGGTYVLGKQPLTVSVAGSGSVSSSNSAIACPGVCTTQIHDNDTVSLAAAPASGQVFRGWTGGCSGTGACQVTMETAKSVTATFSLPEAIPRMFGISTRMQVLTGDNVIIGGFIIGGTTPKTVIVRARGPSLGVAGSMADPVLTLVPSAGGPATVNDDWQTATNAATVQASGFAPADPKESAIYATLSPGAYTAIVQGVNNTTGIAIVEVYEIDHPEVPLTGISTRGFVQGGDNVMIGGVIIQGDSPQTVVVRARGPSTGVPGALADPTLTLVPAAGGATLTNDDWQSAPNATALQATGLAPGNPKESALLVTLNPGAYTAIVQGAGGTTGVAIVEVYKP